MLSVRSSKPGSSSRARGGGARQEWLVGGGEMGELIRAKDWRATPLGLREGWPPPLRTTLSIVVESRAPMALLWGHDLLMLYNDAYRVIAAHRHPRALGRPTREIWHEVWHSVEPIFTALLERGEPTYLEDQLLLIDRQGRREQAYFTLGFGPVRGEDGSVAGCLVTVLETTNPVRERQALRTERNRAAASAAHEHEVLAGVLEHVPAMISIYDPSLKTFHLNAEARRVLGWTDEDARTGDLMALCYPDPHDRDDVRRFMESAESGWREFEITTKDGERVISSWANVRLSDNTQIGIGIDLRARKEAERELRDSEQQLRALFEGTPAAVVLSDFSDGRILRTNEGFTRMLGFSIEEVLGRSPVELGIFPHPQDRQRLTDEVRKTGSVRNLEVTVRTKSGAPVSGLLSSALIETADGQQLVTVIIDVTERRQAEQALRQSELRFRALATAGAQVLYRMNPDWSEMHHLSGEGFLADTPEPSRTWLQAYIPAAEQARVLAAIHDAIVRKAPFELEHTVRRSDGGLGWVESRAVPVLDDRGEIVEWFGAAIDIGERKEYEAERERILTDLQRARESAEADLEAMSRLQRVSALFLEEGNLDSVLGEIVETAIAVAGADFGTLQKLDMDTGDLVIVARRGLSDDWVKYWNRVGKGQGSCGTALERGQRVVIEDVEHSPVFSGRSLEVQREAGIRSVQSTPLISRSGKPIGVFSTYLRKPGRPSPRALGLLDLLGRQAADIMERVQAEEALRRANQGLLEADRRKNEFLATLSHELRNPLAPIRNSVYILEHARDGSAQAQRARKVIDRQVQHMTRLIEDLLDITRISRGKINLKRQQVDLAALVHGSAEDHREQFESNGIALEINVPAHPVLVNGDPIRLAQAVGNLLSNAIKFTPPGGRTVLSVQNSEGGEAVIRVTDTGVGMPPEMLEQVFEPFVQAEQSLERTRGGLGLGLSLVKGLVEMHGGQVSARSEGEGKGSEFTVRLPLHPTAKPELSGGPAPERHASGRRVLIVEDNVDAAESLREVLEMSQHEVAVATTGPEGLQVAHAFKPDIVLCDIGLPGLDGYGVARALRADADTGLRSIYLVALSGYALEEDVARSLAAGFDQHMAKPPNIEAIEKLLARAPAHTAAH